MKNSEILLKAKKIKFGKELISNSQRSAIIIGVTTPKEISPEAEIHRNYTDIFLIKEGREEVFVGGRILDKKLIAPGEWRGKIYKGAKKYSVSGGDILIIPKGVAHRHGKGKMKLLVIKVR